MPDDGGSGPTTDTLSTRATLLLRLRADDPGREVAWEEFARRYRPMIAAFARKVGCQSADVDDVIQEVLSGFFAAAPSFVYDPARGRFRGYLKTCAVRAVQRRFGRTARVSGLPIETVDPADPKIDELWNAVWEKEILRAAVDRVRDHYRNNVTFRAFELNVLDGIDATEVARRLELMVASVYQAKKRITDALKREVEFLTAERG